MNFVTKSPLGVILCRHDEDQSMAVFLSAAETVLMGSISGKGTPYVQSSQVLPVPIRRFVDSQPPLFQVGKLLEGAMHTLVSVLVDANMLRSGNPWRQWLVECVEAVEASSGRHRLLLTVSHSSLVEELDRLKLSGKRYSELIVVSGDVPVSQAVQFSEFAENPAWHALHLLHSCRTLLAEATFPEGQSKAKLDFFLSHAKKDGIPLVKSIKNMIESQPCLRGWYDVERLAGLADWQTEIQKGVLNSVMVILRTNAYETRPWCRREFKWAFEHSIPMVNVEARTGLFHPPDELTNPNAPTVTLPDGNLFRVLFAAMAESLKMICLLRIGIAMTNEVAEESSRLYVIPFKPLPIHILRAAQQFETNGRDVEQGATILYPDPPLVGFERKSAEWALKRATAGGVALVTPQSVLLEG